MPAAPPPANRSWWLEEALALPEFAGPQAPPLASDVTADVLILGGGYTGMWTAWFLKERDPGLDVVLLEADICGGGPYGRNGGFCDGWWGHIGDLVKTYGEADAMELLMTCGRSPSEIGAWCEANGVDAWFTHGRRPRRRDEPRGRGPVGGHASTPHARSASRTSTGCSRPRRSRSGAHRRRSAAGCSSRDAANVHPGAPGAGPPARPARARRSDLRGHAGHPVRASKPAIAETPGGTVRAGEAVIGLGAWATWWRAFKPVLTVRGSYMVDHRACTRAARGDALDRRRGRPRSPLVDPLRAGDAGRSDRARPGRATAGPRAPHRPALRLRRAVRAPGGGGCRAAVPRVPRRADRGRVGRTDQRIRVHDAVLRLDGARQRALRARLHGQRRRAEPPGRQDPRGARAPRR